MIRIVTVTICFPNLNIDRVMLLLVGLQDRMKEETNQFYININIFLRSAIVRCIGSESTRK